MLSNVKDAILPPAPTELELLICSGLWDGNSVSENILEKGRWYKRRVNVTSTDVRKPRTTKSRENTSHQNPI